MMNEFTVQQGWQCPICKRVYSPLTMMCYYCGGDTVTSTGTGTFSDIDWKKQQTVTTTNNQRIQNYTSISDGRNTFTAEDTRTCDTCKNISGLPSHNGTAEYSGKCKDCYDKCNWEKKENAK